MLREHESFARYWFALCADGDLVRLGDFGDYEAADETAEDMGLEVIWLVCGNDAAQWADTINSVQEEALVARVIEQIKREVYENNFTAIGGLIDCLTTEQLERYLPEEE